MERKKAKRQSKYLGFKQDAEERQREADDARAALKAWSQYQKYRARRRQLEDEMEALRLEEQQNQPPKPGSGDATLPELRKILVDRQRQVQEIKALVATFSATGIAECPTCHTPVADLYDYIEEQKRSLKTLPKDIQAVKRQIEEIEEHQQQVSKYEKWKAGYDARLLANRQSREALKDVKAPDGDRNLLEDVVEQYDQLCRQRDEAKAAYEEVVARCRDLEAQQKASRRRLNEINSEIEENTEPEDRVDEARRRLDEHAAAGTNIARLQGRLEGVQQQIQAREWELTKLKTKLKRSKKIRKLAGIVESVRDLMHRDRLPRRVAQANLLRMEGDINEGLEFFGDPFWVESDENLNFVVHKPGEPAQPASWLSTGQRVVLALSFWSAVASLWSQDLGMLALDEPTANLDEENRKFLSQALGALTAKVRGRRQLIMVTHDPNLRTAFDQVVDL